MSFSLKIDPKDRATGRFKSRVNRSLVKAVIKAKREKNLTQSQIAEQMGVDKSTLSKILNGKGNLTLKTIGDISWVLGLRPEISFFDLGKTDAPGANHHAMVHDGESEKEAPRSSKPSNTVNLALDYVVDRPRTGPSPNERLRVAN